MPLRPERQWMICFFFFLFVSSLFSFCIQNDQVDPSIKPHLVACIGDVALAIGDKFIRYLAVVVMMLSSSGRVQLSPNQVVERQLLMLSAL